MSDNNPTRRSFLQSLGALGALMSLPTVVSIPDREVAVPILEQVGTDIVTPQALDAMLAGSRLGGWQIIEWSVSMARDWEPVSEFDNRYGISVNRQPELSIRAVWTGDEFSIDRHGGGGIVAGGLPLPTNFGRAR